MAVRVAWHASGTYDESAGTGGSNGGTMRYEPERSDPANAGLFIIHDLLLKVKLSMPQLSFADLWTLAGCKAVEFMGGPRIPFAFGRVDAPDKASTKVPPNGLLPDASQGAQHLREVFGRMGFNDREIVALSGGHTVGRCHKVRSGYDGAWTRQPLTFDNEYYVNLMTLEWKLRDWDGPLQVRQAPPSRAGIARPRLMVAPARSAQTNSGAGEAGTRTHARAHRHAGEAAWLMPLVDPTRLLGLS